MKNLESSLKGVAYNHIFSQQECHLITNTIIKSQKLEETFRMEIELDKQEKCTKFKRNGLLLCSKDLSEIGKATMPNLLTEDKLSVYAPLIIEDELNLASATTTTVFLDFSAHGNYLGRVYIRVFSNRDRGKLFVMLALGINGQTLKGANFTYKCSNRIQLMNCVTENNSKSSDLLLPVKYEHYDKVSKGSLSKCGPGGFQIFTQDLSISKSCSACFGQVIAGLEVIDRVVSAEFSITDIIISDSGIILGY